MSRRHEPRAADATRHRSGGPEPGADVTAWKLGGALAALYVIWGSTYLAIRFAVETLPPFSMAGVRFTIAGGLLYAFARRRAPSPPTRRHWKSAGVVGALLLLGGNGGVVWAEQFVPSGLAALLIATVPVWMVTLDWWWGGVRPGGAVLAGLALGVGGVALLSVGRGAAPDVVTPLGTAVLLAAALSWAVGSLYSRHAHLPHSQQLSTAMTMLAGGAWLLLAGVGSGELGRLAGAQVSARSVLALVYLIVFGSLIAFTAYLWLLRATTAARASSYAFVNPVVAVLLGWLLADEALSLRIAAATALIVLGVVLITQYGGRRRRNTRAEVRSPRAPPSPPAGR